MTERPLAYGSHPMHPHEDVCAACGLPARFIKELRGTPYADCGAFRMLAAGKVDNDGRPWFIKGTMGSTLQRAMRLTAEGHTKLMGWVR